MNEWMNGILTWGWPTNAIIQTEFRWKVKYTFKSLHSSLERPSIGNPKIVQLYSY